jgi:hypothetical protein
MARVREAEREGGANTESEEEELIAPALFRSQPQSPLALLKETGREGDDDPESKDEAATVLSPSLPPPQSLASTAVSIHEAAYVSSHIDERPETSVRRPITSEQSRDGAPLGDLTNLDSTLHKESLPDSVTLSDLLGISRVWVCELRGPSAANLADALHCVRNSTACGCLGCSVLHYSDCELM